MSRPRGAALVASLACLFALSGCAGSSETAESSAQQNPPATDTQSSSGDTSTAPDSAGEALSDDEIIQAEIDTAWDNAVQQSPGLNESDRPEVAMVRTVSPAEDAVTMVNCLRESGFPQVEVSDDGGGTSVKLATDAEASAYALAQYVCVARYPLDPKFSRPLSEAQLRSLYDYFAGGLSECLRAQGHRPSSPVSFDEFREKYPAGEGWNPLGEALQSTGGAEEFNALKAACPPEPDGFYDG